MSGSRADVKSATDVDTATVEALHRDLEAWAALLLSRKDKNNGYLGPLAQEHSQRELDNLP